MAEKRHRAPARSVPAPQARDKLAFLLAFVPWLLEHDRVTVAEAAAHFGVSEEVIRSSVSLVAMSGIPGATGTYQHDDLFDIDWEAFENDDEIAITQHVGIDDAPRLSAREAAALIAGLQYLQALPGNADRASIRTLVEKLSRGASAAPSQLAVAGGPDSEILGIVQRAVAEGRRVRFAYLSSRGEREERDVDPLRVESIDADWYLRGWDHLRQGLRTFRFDRMSGLVVTDDPIEHDPAEVHLPDTLFEPSAEDLEVTIEASAEVVGLLADYIADGAVTQQLGDRIRTTLRVSHYHGLKRLVAGMPGTVRVVAPEQARQAIAEWAAAGLARYA
ncbi:MAG TPA: WYL domain-containing protein [Protaetiibacter sp.]|nr:WYL domain-containing protein [Protaetiibacter sp.]